MTGQDQEEVFDGVMAESGDPGRLEHNAIVWEKNL